MILHLSQRFFTLALTFICSCCVPRSFLGGRFDPNTVPQAVTGTRKRAATIPPQLGLVAVGCLGVGSVLTFFFEASWAHIVGVPALLAFVGLGFVALAAQVADA